MTKRPRILRYTGSGVSIKKDSKLRRLFEQYNGCKETVKLKIQEQNIRIA
jgi:hypothetical protein